MQSPGEYFRASPSSAVQLIHDVPRGVEGKIIRLSANRCADALAESIVQIRGGCAINSDQTPFGVVCVGMKCIVRDFALRKLADRGLALRDLWVPWAYSGEPIKSLGLQLLLITGPICSPLCSPDTPGVRLRAE
jgi:hypothetical protein